MKSAVSILSWTFSAIFLQFCYCNEDSLLVRNLTSGAVLGKMLTLYNPQFHTYSFRGIPFADQPIKDRRYRRPSPAVKWNAVLNAESRKLSCLEKFSKYNSTQEVEDCLYLNVYSPASCLTTGNCPVAVLLPENERDSQAFIELNRYGIVVVILTHRVGSFAFLNLSPVCRADQDKDIDLFDIMQGLSWTQEEIENFGGNKDQVTVIAANEEAIRADLLSLSPKSKGLFRSTVLSSGAFAYRHVSEYSNCFSSRQLSIRAQCAENYTKFDSSAEANIVIDCLRSRSSYYLIGIENELASSGVVFDHLSFDQSEEIFPSSIQNLSLSRPPINVFLLNNREERLADRRLSVLGEIEERVASLCEYYTRGEPAYQRDCLALYRDRNRAVNFFNDYRIYSATVETAETVTNSNGSAFIVEYQGDLEMAMVLKLSRWRQLKDMLISFIHKSIPRINDKPVPAYNHIDMNYVKVGRFTAREANDFHSEPALFWIEVKRTHPLDEEGHCSSNGLQTPVDVGLKFVEIREGAPNWLLTMAAGMVVLSASLLGLIYVRLRLRRKLNDLYSRLK